jgi:hypothetical protein
MFIGGRSICRTFLVLMTVLISLAFVSNAQAQFQYRKSITIDKSKVTAPAVPDLPVVVDTTTSATTDPNAAPSLNWTHTPTSGANFAVVSVTTTQQAITADAGSSLGFGGVSSGTLTNYTVGAGSNKALIVSVCIRNNTTVSTVTWGGTPLSLIGAVNNTGNARVELWGLLNATPGTANVVVTMSAVANFVVGAVAFSNVGTIPAARFVSATGTSNAPSRTVGSAAGELVVDALANLPATATIGAGQTPNWSSILVTGQVRGSGSREPGAASVTMSWTLSASVAWAIGAVPLTPASTTPPAISSVTYAGQPMTQIGSVVNTGKCQAAMYYYYQSPLPAGPNTVVVTLSGAARAAAGVTSFFNVDSIAPIRQYQTATGTTSPASATVSSWADDVVLDVIAHKDSNYDVATGLNSAQIERWHEYATSTYLPDGLTGAGSTRTPPPFSTTTTWTVSGSGTDPAWALMAASIKAATSTEIVTTLTNYPMLFSVTDPDLRSVGNGGKVEKANPNDPWDVIFRGLDTTTCGGTWPCTLDHEIEKYDATTGKLVAWVKLPSVNGIAAGSDTVIYIYYGNASISSSTQHKNQVWSNGFREVWHLHETSGGVSDSASNYTGTVQAGVNQNPATEKIDGADGFDGSTNAYETLNDGTITANTPLTLESWFYLTTVPADGAFISFPSKHREYSGTNDWVGLYAERDTTGVDHASPWGRAYPALTFGWGNSGGNLLGSSQLAAGQWYYAMATYNGTRRHLYLNAVHENVDTGATYGTNLTLASRIGNDGLSTAYLNGFADEVRISTVARTPGWVLTSYNNMNNPGNIGSPGFYTVGAQQGPSVPTAVKLTSFTATAHDGGVLLRWHTGYEVDNLGFHIYREENGKLYRLTPEPVAGSAFLAGKGTALGAGHSYSWWDAGLSPQSSSLRYWLKDIDLSGKHTMHGPVEVQLSALRSQLLASEVRKSELLSERGMKLQERYRDFWRIQDLKEKLALKRLEGKGAPRGRGLRTGNKVPLRSGPTGLEGKGFHRQSDSSANEVQRYLASKSAVKIPVKEEGWYRVTQPELLAVGLSSKVNPKYLQLFVEGQEQPIRLVGKKDEVFGPRDAIEFYGVGLDTPSTDTRVYWLIEGTQPGKRIDNHIFNPPFRNPHSAIRNSFGSFPYTVEKKDRTVYFPTFKNGDLENFFGPMIYQSRVDQLLEVWHPDPAPPGEALLEVSLLGATTGSHHVKVLFNNDEVGEIVFEGQSLGGLKVEVSHSEIREGENLVSLIPEGGEMDLSLLDTIRLTYWHTYRAEDNRLRFTARGGEHLTLSGFRQSRIRVFDITEPNDPMEVIGKVESQGRSYGVSFRVPGHGERTLLAITEEHLKNPEGVVSNHPSSWHQGREGYDLVIISHRDFLSSLQPLKTLRESQGLRVGLIDIEDLYDEFSFGNKSPQAIKDFLTLAKGKWRRPLRFVLLVGDASFDPRNYLGYGELDFVPTKLVDTAQLETASDDWFVDLNNDGLPEVAIGRLPVQTVEEAAIVVSKIVGYEKSRRVNEALLVADKSEGSNDFNFEGASEEVRALLPSYLTVREINRGDFGSDGQAKQELLNGINQGPLLVDYIGHGSVEVWRGNLFSSDDAEGLVNAYRLPFFVSMTCLNGFFQAPYADTLAEALLKAKGGGAVAVWASSGLTEPDGQALMNKELIKLLFGRESITLGEATAKAKASVSDQDIRKTWILFGDPTTRLRP